MSQSLNLTKEAEKHSTLDLTKEVADLRNVTLKVFWPLPEEMQGKDVDLDLCALGLDRRGTIHDVEDLCFFNNQDTGWAYSPDDERSGGSEEIQFSFDELPVRIKSIACYLNIFEGAKKFGDLDKTVVEITNTDTGDSIVTYSVTQAGDGNAFYIGNFVKDGDRISFEPKAQVSPNADIGNIMVDNGWKGDIKR